jgi:predicted metal-dependent HD superfamily phosphohydrolase
MTDLDRLRASWRDLLSAAGADPNAGDAVFAALIRAYAEPWRHYHNLAHLAQVLEGVWRLRGRTNDSIAVELAAWFHDAVYDPRASDNEERSADLAADALGKLGMGQQTIDNVQRLILLTKTHRATRHDIDSAVLLDSDLAILGAPAEEYRAYAEAIRREYSWVEETAYRAGRSRVLRGFLARERIYHNPDAFQALEASARRNVEAELRALGAADEGGRDG